MNRPTIVRISPPPLLDDVLCVGSDELPSFPGVFSPAAALMLAVLGVPEPAASAVAAGTRVRAPTITTPRISVSDLFIEGRLRGRVLPMIGRGGRYLRGPLRRETASGIGPAHAPLQSSQRPLRWAGSHHRRAPPPPMRELRQSFAHSFKQLRGLERLDDEVLG